MISFPVFTGLMLATGKCVQYLGSGGKAASTFRCSEGWCETPGTVRGRALITDRWACLSLVWATGQPAPCLLLHESLQLLRVLACVCASVMEESGFPEYHPHHPSGGLWSVGADARWSSWDLVCCRKLASLEWLHPWIRLRGDSLA